MISKLYRFHGRGSLNFVYRKGKTVRSEYLSLRYAPGRQEDYHLAIVVSKKVSKSAVKRNRIRRVLYEIVRCYHKEAGKKWPYDMVLTVFDEKVSEGTHKELESTVQGLIDKAVR